MPTQPKEVSFISHPPRRKTSSGRAHQIGDILLGLQAPRDAKGLSHSLEVAQQDSNGEQPGLDLAGAEGK